MWHFLPRAQKFAVHFTLHGKIFRNFVALKTYPIAELSKWAHFRHIVYRLTHASLVSWLCAALLQFRQDASLARSGSFPIRQLTVRRWAAGDYGHNIGNALFSSSVRTVFPLPCILSPCAQGRNYGIILARPFQWRYSQYSQRLAKVLTYFRHSE